MALHYHDRGNDPDDRKISGFSKRERTRPTSELGAGETGHGKRNGRLRLGRQGNRWWISLLVDMLLLVILAGIVVGGIYGYRFLRELYAPTWETREVVFCVEMTGIDPGMVKYGQDGRPTFVNNPIWSSDQIDADFLGTVTDVQTVLVALEDGTNTLTLYLTVEADAYYRSGKGYRMGETMLLAGTEDVYRLEGLSSAGIVISMHEKADEATDTAESESAWREPGVIDPEAQG